MSDDILTNINHPEGRILRQQARNKATDGRLQRKACFHPTSAVEQFVDEESGTRYHRPLNYFMCTACGMTLWMVDAFGREAQDG